MSIRIITDSASDLPLKMAGEMGVTVVPLSVQFGEDTYLDGRTIRFQRFYELLKSSTANPTTSQPAPELFLREFEAAKEAGDQVVVISLSSALSGTMQSAMIARELCDYEPVYIVDSRSATAGMQLLVHEACRLRDGGMDAAAIAAELEKLRERVRIFATIDTLEYLRRGGRLSDLAANIGTVTKLKPTITVRDGQVEVIGKSFGSAAALKHLLKIVQEHPMDGEYPVYLVYTDDMTRDEPLLEKLKLQGLLPCEPELRGIGATIGTHVGTGACGVVYIEKA